MKEADAIYQRALKGSEKVVGSVHMHARAIAKNLGRLYADQDQMEKAEVMDQRALKGIENALGPEQT